MAFIKRLGFFLFGLSIGLVFLTIFLKKKSQETGTEFCYFPNCRTLKDIRAKQISYSDAIGQLIQQQELDSTDINGFLYNGEVDFGKSETKTKPCKTYYIEGMVKDKAAILKVKNCSEKAVIESVAF
ncbi:hypothetical protein [Arenibacter algicola]|jgi:hypothetical protein|uniref:DUF4258 domain-containing protein n=1 Tax=Arenibacter algicola TaxID=616991 RepID=A0A221V2A4_9FLAO|nr:hypothetical protein [Arenibacter algicola]ASO07663.1 hypothetical protein AREALGSMS7_04261 [Arenibacter algicola]HCO86230.1 hypothetical protein [Arenibacter sp.]|tara:strand:- start:44456 stop:44836 length:381 start_codon:yes stop_codon:yes gene_type:complete